MNTLDSNNDSNDNKNVESQSSKLDEKMNSFESYNLYQNDVESQRKELVDRLDSIDNSRSVD